jgi:hypothetical protein
MLCPVLISRGELYVHVISILYMYNADPPDNMQIHTMTWRRPQCKPATPPSQRTSAIDPAPIS